MVSTAIVEALARLDALEASQFFRGHRERVKNG